MVVYSYDTKIGKITVEETDNCITGIHFENDELPSNIDTYETPLIKEAIKQIKLYLDGKLKYINVPIKIKGSDFQKLVWNELTKIPYGETCTYKDIAKKVGNEKACRAVGNANSKNNLPIIIPCHRVVGTNGKLVGFAGGLDIKEKLIDIEKKHK